MSLKEDFYSTDYKKLIYSEMNNVMDIADYVNVEPNIGNIHNVFDACGRLASLAKNITKATYLDRHKLLAVIAVSILENSPLVMIDLHDNKYSTGSYYANDMLALNVIQRMLYDELIPEFGRTHKIDENDLRKYLSSIAFPIPTKDEIPVEKSLLNTFHLANKALVPFMLDDTPETNEKKNTVAIGYIFLISHIIYYLEKHNWDVLLSFFNPPIKGHL